MLQFFSPSAPQKWLTSISLAEAIMADADVELKKRRTFRKFTYRLDHITFIQKKSIFLVHLLVVPYHLHPREKYLSSNSPCLGVLTWTSSLTWTTSSWWSCLSAGSGGSSPGDSKGKNYSLPCGHMLLETFSCPQYIGPKNTHSGSQWPWSRSWGRRRRRLPPTRSPTWSRPTSGTWFWTTLSLFTPY